MKKTNSHNSGTGREWKTPIPKIREQEGNEKIHSHNSGKGIRPFHSWEWTGTGIPAHPCFRFVMIKVKHSVSHRRAHIGCLQKGINYHAPPLSLVHSSRNLWPKPAWGNFAPCILNCKKWHLKLKEGTIFKQNTFSPFIYKSKCHMKLPGIFGNPK